MVSMVFPDFGPNVGKISEMTGSYRRKGPRVCLVLVHYNKQSIH